MGDLRFDKLNETNYAEWVMLIEALLTRKGLLEIVTGEITKPMGSPNAAAVKSYVRKAAEARAEIVLHVEPSQLPHVRDADVTVVWENLKSVHQARGFGTRMSRRRTLFGMRMDPQTPMSRWIADVRRAAFLLEEVGGTVTNDDMILVLTNGLPRSYDTVIGSLDSISTDDLTLDAVVNRLLNEESRQTTRTPARAERPTNTNTDPNNIAFAANADRKPRTPLHLITCYACGEKGHYQADCKKPAAGANTAQEIQDFDVAW